MHNVKIRMGVANAVELQFPAGTTIGQVLSDARVKAALGFGDNVRPLVDRVIQDRNTPVFNGMVIDLESQANAKA